MHCFFFNDTATTEIYTLSLHDALPISWRGRTSSRRTRIDRLRRQQEQHRSRRAGGGCRGGRDRKSTRLNSSHANISYAVFCLKKKNNSCLDLNLNNLHFHYKYAHHLAS